MANSHFEDKSHAAIKLGEFLGHQDEIRAICFSHNPNYDFSGGWDKKIIRWQIPSKLYKESRKSIDSGVVFSGHKGSITSLHISKDDCFLYSSSKDGTVRIWDVQNANLLKTVIHSNSHVYALNVAENGRYIFSGGMNAQIKIWECLYGKNRNIRIRHKKTIRKPLSTIHVIQLSPENDYFACSGDENSIYLWNFPKCHFIRRLDGHKKYVYWFDFHPRKPFIASGGKEKKIFVWNYLTGQIVNKINVPSSISYLKFHPKKDFLLAADFQNRVKIFNVNTSEILQNICFSKGDKLTVGLSEDWELFGLVPFNVRPNKFFLWSFPQSSLKPTP